MEDLKEFDASTLIRQGDDHRIVPIADSAMLSAQLIRGAKLKVYFWGSPWYVLHSEGPHQRRPHLILQNGMRLRMDRRTAAASAVIQTE